jgi:uncharacterized RDD family membrane protein YckC
MCPDGHTARQPRLEYRAAFANERRMTKSLAFQNQIAQATRNTAPRQILMHRNFPSDTSETFSDPRFCGLTRRLAAMIYDGLLLIAIWMLAAMLVVIPASDSIRPGNPAFQAYLLIIAWTYFAICWRGGQTLGMKAWRIRIVGPDQPISWLATAVRFGVAIASLLCFGLGLWWSLFHPNKATWHDLASGTRLVVEPRSKTPRPFN